MNINLIRRLVRSRWLDSPRHLRERIFRRLTPLFVWPQKVEISPGLFIIVDPMRFPSQNKYFWTPESVEPALQWALRTLLPKGGIFVDCGSNIGLMALIAAHYQAAHCHCMEPLPRLADWIEDEIHLNHLESLMQVHKVAASDSTGDATFYLSRPDKDGSHGLAENRYSIPNQCVTVKKQRLDEFLPALRIANVDFLKIDTEQHDYEVLSGAGDWLTPERIQMVYVEMNDRADQILEIMIAAGYVAWVSNKFFYRAVRDGYDPRKHTFYKRYHPSAVRISRNTLFCGKESAANRKLMELFG